MDYQQQPYSVAAELSVDCVFSHSARNEEIRFAVQWNTIVGKITSYSKLEEFIWASNATSALRFYLTQKVSVRTRSNLICKEPMLAVYIW